MAEHIRNGNFDRDAVAHVFEITGSFPNSLIAQAIRAGEAFNLNKLAEALMRLGAPPRPTNAMKAVPTWMEKAAIEHYNGMRLSDALGLDAEYSNHQKWRAYQRFMSAEYRAYQRSMAAERRKRGEPDIERELNRSKPDIERELNQKWPKREPALFPKLEQAIRNTLRGDGIPLEVYRSLVWHEFSEQVEREILKKGVL
jgi:hypothetical protein